jgi:hypothetical protein
MVACQDKASERWVRLRALPETHALRRDRLRATETRWLGSSPQGERSLLAGQDEARRRRAKSGGGGSRTRTQCDHELIDGARLLELSRSLGGSCRLSLTSLTSSRNTRNPTLSLERYWRRRDDAPAADARGCSRRLHTTGDRFTRWRLVLAGTSPYGLYQKEARS